MKMDNLFNGLSFKSWKEKKKLSDAKQNTRIFSQPKNFAFHIYWHILQEILILDYAYYIYDIHDKTFHSK